MTNSLIIAYYKNIEALQLILKALEHQSTKHFDVIIAEDDNNTHTKNFIAEIKTKLPFTIKHVYQEVDNGFRKNQMLNKAIQIAHGEMIVFLDGDCIPHKHFIKAYAHNNKQGIAYFGRRVMLDENTSKQFTQTQDLKKLSFWNLIFTKSKRLKYALYAPSIRQKRTTGIWGCNWGILKKHLVAINGFDEDYIKAGVGEDIDIEWRLKQQGIQLLSIRFSAIVYHLHHKENYSNADVQFNFNLFEQKKQQGNIYCLHGLTKTV